MLGTLAYGVLGTIIVPALPFFEGVLHTSETGVTWLITAYLLGAAAATAVLGRLGDMFGKRRMLMITLVVLAIGTFISAVTDSIGWQIVGRVVQGVAGGLLPLSFGIIRDEFPKERVAGAIGASWFDDQPWRFRSHPSWPPGAPPELALAFLDSAFPDAACSSRGVAVCP